MIGCAAVRAAIALIILCVAAPAAAEKKTLLVDSPCPGPACTADLVEPQAQGRRVVYLAFDGVTLTRSQSNDDARTNTSAIVNSSTEVIPAFNISSLSSTNGMTRAQIIDAVIDDLYTIHADFNVDFVTTRPSSGYYSMIVFGGSCGSVAGSTNCAGIALLDCGDQMPANITFVFPGGLRVADLATTAAQEAAHAFGLGHTSDVDDVMYPQIRTQVPSGFGAGNIPDGSGCPSSATYQDSYQKMMQTIGPRGQDTVGPLVIITSPTEGATIGGGTSLTASISDDIAVARARLEIDGQLHGEKTDPPWSWGLPLLSAGTHQLTVRAWDLSNNDGFARVNVNVDAGTGPSCNGPEDCETWEDCVNGQCQGSPDGELGDPCTSAQECLSGLCATSGDDQRCTQTCDAATPCPEGFDCLNGTVCWPGSGGGGGGEGEGGGCAAGRGGAAPLLVLVGILLAAVRRRRSAR